MHRALRYGICIGILCSASTSICQTTYKATDLGKLPNAAWVFGDAVNDNGRIAGVDSYSPDGSSSVAVAWAQPGINAQQMVPAQYNPQFSWSSGINSSDDAVGWFRDADGIQWPYSYNIRTGVFTLIGVEQGASATGLNEEGIVVGYGGTGRGQAFTWNGTTVKWFPGPDPQATLSQAFGINNFGDIAGAVWDHTLGNSVAAIYEAATSRWNRISVPPTHAYSQILSINDNGWAVGYWTNSSKVAFPLVARKDGSTVNFATPPANDYMQLLAVNNSGLAVGRGLMHSSGTYRAIAYDIPSDTWVDLTNKIVNPEILTALDQALGISPNGRIVGSGYVNVQGIGPEKHAFLLTPTSLSGTTPNTTAIFSGWNPSTVNQAVTLTATVTGVSGSGVPTGNVVFLSNVEALPDCGGINGLALTPGPGVTSTAACTTTVLTASFGNALTARYLGDSVYDVSVSPALTQMVAPLHPVVSMISTPVSPSPVNTSVTFTASLTGVTVTPVAPEGTMTFFANGSAISSCSGLSVSSAGTASCVTSALPTGTNSITALYSGDSNFVASAPGALSYAITVQQPIANILPNSIDFGTLYLGSVVTKAITVSNIGDAPMNIANPLLALVKGGDSKEFVAVNLCPRSLSPGKSCTMLVTFIAGPFYTPQTAVLTINDDAAGSPQTVALSAQVIHPVAWFSSHSLNFGKAKIGTAVSKEITLISAGGTALLISGIGISGVNQGDFTATNMCSSVLEPKSSCSLRITFQPMAKGSRAALLTVTDNAKGSPQFISLVGTGL